MGDANEEASHPLSLRGYRGMSWERPCLLPGNRGWCAVAEGTDGQAFPGRLATIKGSAWDDVTFLDGRGSW
jgi:hypothetical protein